MQVSCTLDLKSMSISLHYLKKIRIQKEVRNSFYAEERYC